MVYAHSMLKYRMYFKDQLDFFCNNQIIYEYKTKRSNLKCFSLFILMVLICLMIDIYYIVNADVTLIF
jgi:hypothetical protein